MEKAIIDMIKFLSEDCDWPIDEDLIERSAWQIDHAEIGINESILLGEIGIYELRPLTGNQPWGVFFLHVKQSQSLSVTLLRKLLKGLVKKKRTTPSSSQSKRWNLEDLLFICTLDKDDVSTQYFAHFKQNKKISPKLMIGSKWQTSQPMEEIRKAKSTLSDNLKWPNDTTDIEKWRNNWSFSLEHKEIIRTSSMLAKSMARHAAYIKQTIPELYDLENNNGPMHHLFRSFNEYISQGSDIGEFADMIAQTLTYGLFSARSSGTELLGINSLAESIPKTNPFLKHLFRDLTTVTGPKISDLDFDDLGINHLIHMLNSTKINDVLSEFGSQFMQGKEDPVIHFYETFLSEYNPKKRIDRGVFYTPKPVVDFMINYVHRKIVNEQGLELGLADSSTHMVNGVEWPKVLILDPATGTGTFISALIEKINRVMINHWKKSGYSNDEIIILWNEYVEDNLVNRIYGFELMMAPYAIANLKVALTLSKTGYCGNGLDRFNIILTNSLSKPKTLANWLPGFISEEATKAKSAKEDVPFTVIIGNPPYSAVSSNLDDDHRSLVNKYKYIDGKKISERGALQLEKNLNDDYIKFFAIGERYLSDDGLLCYITNNSYIENPTLRGFRHNFIQKFESIDILNLEGNSVHRKFDNEGNADKNVFDIRQGVAVSCFSRGNKIKSKRYSTIIGTRQVKYQKLTNWPDSEITFETFEANDQFLQFKPLNQTSRASYEKYPSLTDIFIVYSTGVKTHRDDFCINFSKDKLTEKIDEFVSEDLGNEELREKYKLKDTNVWKLGDRRNKLRRKNNIGDLYTKIYYRPMDIRHIFYDDDVIELSRRDVGQHLINEGNYCIIFMRQVSGEDNYSHFAVSEFMADNRSFFSNRGTMSMAHLFDLSNNAKPSPNIHSNFIQALTKHTGISDVNGRTFLRYLTAVMHSSRYKKMYEDFLKIDFPRIPITSDKDTFNKLCQLGSQLISAHLNKNSKFENKVSELSANSLNNSGIDISSPKGKLEISKISKKEMYRDGTIFLDSKAKTDGTIITGVPSECWEFQLGGYNLLEKWIYDRREYGGRGAYPISDKDVQTITIIVQSIKAIIRITNEIDSLIDSLGGWPLEGCDNFPNFSTLDSSQKTLF